MINRPGLTPPAFGKIAKNNITQIRLRLYIPPHYHQEPVISRLISQSGLRINITGAMLGENTNWQGCFDLEICGTLPQISKGLAYLESLNMKIKGKPNAWGDSWNC
ncbi:MAG: NIL domain-containing protein [Heteroscytonema crispum UTEX LB 1556]